MPNPANPPPGAGHRYLPQQRSQAWLRPSCSCTSDPQPQGPRSEEHTSELQSRLHLVCRLLLEKKKISYRGRPLDNSRIDALLDRLLMRFRSRPIVTKSSGRSALLLVFEGSSHCVLATIYMRAS